MKTIKQRHPWQICQPRACDLSTPGNFDTSNLERCSHKYYHSAETTWHKGNMDMASWSQEERGQLHQLAARDLGSRKLAKWPKARPSPHRSPTLSPNLSFWEMGLQVAEASGLHKNDVIPTVQSYPTPTQQRKSDGFCRGSRVASSLLLVLTLMACASEHKCLNPTSDLGSNSSSRCPASMAMWPHPMEKSCHATLLNTLTTSHRVSFPTRFLFCFENNHWPK
jgi:hypothetical protein